LFITTLGRIWQAEGRQVRHPIKPESGSEVPHDRPE